MTIESVSAGTVGFQTLWRADRGRVEPPADDGGGWNSTPPAAPALTGTAPLLASRDLVLLQRRDVAPEERAAYEYLLAEFSASRVGGEEPQAFLDSLSEAGIDLLRKVHSFPPDTPVNPGSMTTEEALNFILPDSRQVDLDNDGLLSSANGAKSWRFPPVNAPQEVKDAWEEATRDLSERDVMLFSGMFMVLTIEANLKYDAAGNPVGLYQPGDPEYSNPFAEPDFSYRNMVDDMLSRLERFRSYETDDSYAWKKDMLSRFASALDDQEVA